MRSSRRAEETTNAGTAGAVFVEFLIVFVPVLTMFLCLFQLALLYAVRIAVDHAAMNAARTAAVVIGDKADTSFYEGNIEAQNELDPPNGGRYKAIRRAAILSLAPFIMNGTITKVELKFPPPDQPGGDQPGNRPLRYSAMENTNVSKVRVRVEVEAFCKIGLADRIMCGGILYRAKNMQAEAMFPSQGARYTYP